MGYRGPLYWVRRTKTLERPLVFVLGMPFPLGLRVVMQRSSALGAWAWGVILGIETYEDSKIERM